MPEEKQPKDIVGKVGRREERKRGGNWKRSIEGDVKGTAGDAGRITETPREMCQNK